ncbi:MAG: alcohol dehydrogenase [Bacillota bacterium]|nr:alcohol dehydrogenase [Bacillota bacterium]
MAEYVLPPVVLLRPGVARSVGQEVAGLGCRKVLIVTDRFLVEMGLAGRIQDNLRQAGVESVIYSGVNPDPTTGNVAGGIKLLKENGCDAVVGIGGGSALDCGKTVAYIGAAFPDDVPQAMRKPAAPGAGGLPFIAIPTTAGTGSEATQFVVITDPVAKEKMVIVNRHLMARLALDDPELTATMPPKMTAATGMDALAHAVEAYVSPNASPLSDALALKAVRLIGHNLRQAFAQGNDMAARTAMMEAQLLAGMAFNNAGVGYAHAMAHPLGARYHVHHGVCCSLLLPQVCAFNLSLVPERYAEIAAALGRDVRGLSAEAAAQQAVEAIVRLRHDLKLPERLSEVGAREEDLLSLAEEALHDRCALTNPRQATREEVARLYLGSGINF